MNYHLIVTGLLVLLALLCGPAYADTVDNVTPSEITLFQEGLGSTASIVNNRVELNVKNSVDMTGYYTNDPQIKAGFLENDQVGKIVSEIKSVPAAIVLPESSADQDVLMMQIDQMNWNSETKEMNYIGEILPSYEGNELDSFAKRADASIPSKFDGKVEVYMDGTKIKSDDCRNTCDSQLFWCNMACSQMRDKYNCSLMCYDSWRGCLKDCS